MKKNQFVRDIREKDAVASPFLVKFSALAVDKNGKSYMNFVFSDQSGDIEGKAWEDANRYAGQVVQDAVVWLEGRCQLFQGRRQVVVGRMQVLRGDEVDLTLLLPSSHLDADALYAQLLQHIASMTDPDYRALAEAVLKDDEEIREKLKKAPAAKSMHHAYPSGLLEHICSITRTLDFMARNYGPILDRDLLLLGGFFHDIGKIWELSYEKTTDYTTEGRLIGHLVMGVELVERKVRELEAQPGRLSGDKFPEDKKLLIKHVILAHHGQLEYGSPKRPKCVEALIVHMVDDLDSKVNSIHRFIEQDETPGSWTGLNRQYNRYFYKQPRVKG